VARRPHARIGAAAARPAAQAQLLDIGGRVRFRHPLVRSAVYRAAEDGDRRAAHGRSKRPRIPRRIPIGGAWHRAHAATVPDDDVALELVERAARAEARAGSPLRKVFAKLGISSRMGLPGALASRDEHPAPPEARTTQGARERPGRTTRVPTGATPGPAAGPSPHDRSRPIHLLHHGRVLRDRTRAGPRGGGPWGQRRRRGPRRLPPLGARRRARRPGPHARRRRARPGRREAAVAAAVQTFGRIDVVHNNAGYGVFGAVEEVTDEQARGIFDTNVFGVLNVLRATLPVLRAQRAGHILQGSSFYGQSAHPGVGLLCATKYAVEGLSDALVGELEPLGIRVTMVQPGATATPFGSNFVPAAGTIADYDPTVREVAKATAALPPSAYDDPDRVAAAILVAVDAPRPPLRLATGTSGLDVMRDALRSRLDEQEAWRSTSAAVDATPAAVS
jgi:NAD(P)-dependent dehydrogenase (short-subunit alcohol dehydrogenase family)